MVYGPGVGGPGGVNRSGSPCVDVPGSRDAAPAGTGRLSLITNLDHHESSLNHEHGSRSTPVAMSGVATDTVTETTIESASQRHLTVRGLPLGVTYPRKTSLSSYMFYQPQWFNPDLPDSTIAGQAGILPSVFLPMVRRRYTQRLPFRRIFTRNVSFTLVANFLLAFHVGTFNSLWFVFLYPPVYDPTKTAASPNALVRNPPFIFTGSLGLQPREVSTAMAILDVIGIGLQLGLYPCLSARLGTVRSWHLFLLFLPITYFLVPYLSLVPSSSPPSTPKDGIAVWVAMAGVLALQVAGRTFVLPAQTILVNNCTPHPGVLGTVHGIGQSVSSFAITLGPMLCGLL
ncbi:hypothetical protein B0T13DRAFT_486315 [Neurospora crassa]|nr:hypothetical protein B0T13DRAFT_486315 [Neurospora crassa]